MVFSSIVFIFYFLPLVLLFYYLFPNKFKNLTLFIFSLLFYSWGEPIYIFLMLFSCLSDYIHSIIIDKYRSTIYSKIALISSISINIGILIFFKYLPFNLPLPIGISFYTFQTMSYSIDVYRGNVPVQKNFLTLATYVTLFPQLVAGPIVRYIDIEKELDFRVHNLDTFYQGVYRFIVGLSKKVLLANNLGIIWNNIKISPIHDLSLFTSWLGIICFTLQIYFDFSGYSDMAIGLGKMFGFTFPENFNFPYISKSITEFWRRWHISLGSWFRDYVYIPLGGNRCSKHRWFFNIFVVWFLTGIWHGASFNFILWGLYFGIILVLEKLFILNLLNKLPNLLRHFYTLFIIILGFVLFEFNSLSSISSYLKSMLFNSNLIDYNFIYYFVPNIVLLLISFISCTPIIKYILDKYNLFRFVFLLLGLILSTSFLVDSSFNPFLYFRF
ncbi:MBOAT family O-acyltransferase [Paraclostridium bifermentans]|uniref:MBOAT family O-acyltransferase n=2 Tax=Paraclostridium bifermentans TaxID=1490 RepID=UPI00359CA77E